MFLKSIWRILKSRILGNSLLYNHRKNTAMRIRFKILLGFFTLIAMLAIAGTYSVIEFSKISKSVISLLDDNYKTIEASKNMLEALEREDSGILLLLHGDWEKGRQTLNKADSSFIKALNIARNNITEKNEDKHIIEIDNVYIKFKKKWKYPIVGTQREGSIDWYFNELHPAFWEAKNAVNKLMSLNQDSMHNEAISLKEKSKRTIMPGIVAIISALVFLFMFNFFINRYFVAPLERLIISVNNFNPGHTHFDAKIETHDELKELETAIKNLTEKTN